MSRSIFNYCLYKMWDLKLLNKGLNYVMPPKKSNYGDCKTPFKAFYRKIGKLLIEDHRLGKVETDIKKSILILG